MVPHNHDSSHVLRKRDRKELEGEKRRRKKEGMGGSAKTWEREEGSGRRLGGFFKRTY